MASACSGGGGSVPWERRGWRRTGERPTVGRTSLGKMTRRSTAWLVFVGTLLGCEGRQEFRSSDHAEAAADSRAKRPHDPRFTAYSDAVRGLQLLVEEEESREIVRAYLRNVGSREVTYSTGCTPVIWTVDGR